MKRKFGLALCGALTAMLVSSAQADIITIDDSDVGTIYDGILDGFPFPPPGAPQDGTPDFTGNSLAIALQSGVTEERGIAELSLAELAGLGSADLVSATLTFNIDDVIGTFGPGTVFDGTAAETIILFAYEGDGSIDLADFGEVAGSPLSVIDTTPLGTITDATLSTSGPLQFEVDVTTALGSLLDSSATHLGVVFTTNDDLSATSIDNLGDGGAGPAGVDGAVMPFLVVETVALDPPLFSKDQLKCQKGIAKAGAKHSKTVQKLLAKCLDEVLKATSKGQDLDKATQKCLDSLDAGNPDSKLAKSNAKTDSSIAKKCEEMVPADVNSPCDPAATTMSELAACIVDQHSTSVQTAVRAEYADACALISAVGLGTEFPELCATP